MAGAETGRWHARYAGIQLIEPGTADGATIRPVVDFDRDLTGRVVPKSESKLKFWDSTPRTAPVRSARPMAPAA